jgi:capsular exopolysaccharide synthesis family protein
LIDKEENRQLYQSSNSGSLLESYRILRSNVRFATVDEPVCSILVTSTIPGEGKSTTAANLAVAMALDERRVILVDADLRRPTVHKKFNMQLKPGLTDVLVGVLPLEAALRDTNIPGLRVLAAGPIPPNPVELLSSRTMHQIHRTLKEMADVIIFDSPPCLVTADAQVLSAEVDGVLYVMQFGETKKTGARHAVELLSRAQARLLGVVFNKISVESNSYYSGYYHYGSEQIEPMRGNGVSKHLPSQNHLSEAVVKHDRSTEEGKPISSSEHENKDLKET